MGKKRFERRKKRQVVSLLNMTVEFQVNLEFQMNKGFHSNIANGLSL